jgi:hypothetical protein
MSLCFFVSANLWCHLFAYEFDFKNLNLEITESFVHDAQGR